MAEKVKIKKVKTTFQDAKIRLMIIEDSLHINYDDLNIDWNLASHANSMLKQIPKGYEALESYLKQQGIN